MFEITTKTLETPPINVIHKTFPYQQLRTNFSDKQHIVLVCLLLLLDCLAYL